MAQLVKNPPAMWEIWVRSPGWEDPWRRERLHTPVFWPRKFHGLYSPGVSKGSDMTERLPLSLSSHTLGNFHWENNYLRQTQVVNDFPGGSDSKNLPAMQWVWVWSLEKIPWRREWLHTPLLWAGEFHGERSLAGYSPWDGRESDTTEQLTLSLFFNHVLNKRQSW